MKWKRTKKGGKDATKEGRGATEEEEDEEEDAKLEIDDSDAEDANNISVDDDLEDGGIMVSPLEPFKYISYLDIFGSQ